MRVFWRPVEGQRSEFACCFVNIAGGTQMSITAMPDGQKREPQRDGCPLSVAAQLEAVPGDPVAAGIFRQNISPITHDP